MIVRRDKGIEISTNPSYKSVDWYNEGNYVVDETTEEGKALAEKIKSNHPHFEFVLDKYGDLVDITPTGKPIEEVKQKKISELNIACEQAILGYFKATVDGLEYSFSNDVEAQSNFKDALWAFEKGKLTTIKWTAYDAEDNIVRLDIDIEKLSDVNIARLTHQQTQVAKFRDILEPKVKAATTVGEVESIVW